MWSKIVIIGAGGVAESLLFNLAQHQLHPIAIYNRTRDKALALANRYSPSTDVVDQLAKIPLDADGYLFALSDSAIPEVASMMPSTGGIWMHTSATVPLETLTHYHSQSAIFYPLNTFSSHIAVKLEGTPLFYETKSDDALCYLLSLAKTLAVRPITSTLELRRKMHVAAVFSCNFVNHLLTKASFLMEKEGLPFDLLMPLVEETIRKAFAEAPASVQTGPARRGDLITIQRHRKELQEMAPDFIPLYDLLSSSILKQYHSSSSLSHE